MKSVLMPTPQLHIELSGQLSCLHSFHCSTFSSPCKIEWSQCLEGEAEKWKTEADSVYAKETGNFVQQINLKS